MAMKELFQDLRPLPLYVMFSLTFIFFILELVISHLTHALTLLVDSYHTLCNLITLLGCIITIKYGHARNRPVLERKESNNEEELVSNCKDSQVNHSHSHSHSHGGKKGHNSEKKLRNTFGWARVEVLVMLIGAIFLASLLFSLIVEAVQTLCHMDHSDAMHLPIPVILVGCLGLILNAVCYILIGGYTFYQGSLLHVMPTGDVVLEDSSFSEDALRQGSRRLSSRRIAAAAAVIPSTESTTITNTNIKPINTCENGNTVPISHYHANLPFIRQGPREMLRDIVGCVFVIICAAVVYYTDNDVAKYVDPIFSIISALILLILSYPYMKESGRILLQTIPDYIDIETLKTKLIKNFPSLLNVHEIHIWCLTPTRVFATAHIVLQTHNDYINIKDELTTFLHKQGITHATIQPEFSNGVSETNSNECYLACGKGACKDSHCCRVRSDSNISTDDEDVSCFGTSHHHHGHGHGHSHGHNHKEHKHDDHHHNHKHEHDEQNNKEEIKITEEDETEIVINTIECSSTSIDNNDTNIIKKRKLHHQRSLSASMTYEDIASSSGSSELTFKTIKLHSVENLKTNIDY